MATGTPVVVSRIQNRRGLQADFDNLYPAGHYLGIYPTDQPGTGPNVLQPGELALCTDTGHVYMGTTVNGITGFYLDITGSVGPQGPIGPVGPSGPSGATGTLNNVVLVPIITTLAPAATWTSVLSPITETPFFNLLYSVVDTFTANPNIVGTNFSKNGELTVTSTATAATLTDTSAEINATAFDISFRATKVAGNIQLQYIHNFPAALTFSTSSIIWSPI